MKDCIALLGLSGSGKSTLGPLLAQRLGWQFVDTDRLIEARAGQTVAELFAQIGEASFRTLEAQALIAACEPRTVIATGGGCIELASNRTLLHERAINVWCAARPATLAARLANTTDRPLLSDNLLDRLVAQAERRTAHYAALADWIVAVDHLTPGQAVSEIEHGLHLHLATDPLTVSTPGGTYTIRVGAGLLASLPAALADLRLTRRAWIVSDDAVLPLYGSALQQALTAAAIPNAAFAIPAGEAHKNMTSLGLVHDWLLGNGIERGDVVLALGGGVVGDLAGFAASTVLRGVAVVQLPTTVLAMVDSAVGGKTGVDHAAGKNLIGSFHQPRLVLADPNVLHSLSPAERTAGWTEAIKHGVIGDPALFDDLATHANALHQLQEPWLSDVLRRAVAFKARIVSGDEREQGDRILLNYGHTIGHALEAWSAYTIRHGEAVAIGMCVAMGIAQRLGMVDAATVERQHAALSAFGLPTRIPAAADPHDLLARTTTDKKVRSRHIQWVLPTAIGSMTTRHDVPDDLVLAVLQEMRG